MTAAASTRPPKGLPDALPEGETILWQGQPSWRGLAVRVFHVRLIALYFVMLMAWRIAPGSLDGFSLKSAALEAFGLLPLPLAAAGIPALLAFIYARTTIYTITNRRVVMQIGAALPFALNLPFGTIGAAALKLHKDGTADIALTLTGSGRVAYLHLWPHARPWQLRQPEPMLRCVPDGERVAAILVKELEAAQPQPQPPALAARSAKRAGSAPEQLASAAA